MFFVAFALLVCAATLIGFSVAYRLKHFHEYAQLAPDWVTLFPLIGSLVSLVALMLNWTANRLRKRERKRLVALFDVAEKTTQFSDLPSWMRWVKPDRSRPFATATRFLMSALLVTAVTISAGMVLAAPPSVLLKATGGPLVGQPLTTATTVTQAQPSATTGPTHPDATPQLTEYPMPVVGEEPQDITLGPDGLPWYTSQNEDTLGHMSVNGTPTEIQIPSTVKFKYLTTGPDGNLWCAGVDHYGQDATGLPTATPAIFKVTPSGAITPYDLPVATNNLNTYYPQQITAGPDGALWFVDQAFGLVEIGRITTSGSLQQFPLPQSKNSGTESIGGITAGPDGNVWFTETFFLGRGDDAIARITPAGIVTPYPLPTTGDRSQGDQVGGIITGPDGNLWFVEQHTNKIGRITPAGKMDEINLPPMDSGGQPYSVGITVANGSLWVALDQSQFGGVYGLARVMMNGVITYYPLSSPSNSSFMGIVASADGTLWLAEDYGSNRGQIGKVTH